MSEQRGKGNQRPYRTLGWHLKFAREQLKESLAEVSGAVEIDLDKLESIEYGSERPSEDVLLLLMSHLDFKDAEATSLWELAGYSDDHGETSANMSLTKPLDIRIIYTDMVHVMVNDYGVVMNFMQGAGPNNQSLAVARVGMSKEHAKSVLDILQRTLAQADLSKQPKYLPVSDTKSKSKKTNK